MHAFGKNKTVSKAKDEDTDYRPCCTFNYQNNFLKTKSLIFYMQNVGKEKNKI